MPSSTEKIQEFSRNYNLDVTIDQVESTLGAFKYLNDFLNERTDLTSESSKYVNVLATLLNKYLKNDLSPLYYRASYDTSEVDVFKFIEDYEKVMAVRRENGVDGVHKEPYAGLGAGKIYEEMIKRTQGLNKPLAELWTKSVHKGEVDPMELKNKTEAIFEQLRDKDAPLSKTDEKGLEFAVMALKTMNRVYRERRLWRVVPWHWRTWYREAKYMNKLSEQIQTYRQKNFPVQAIEDKYAAPVLKGLHDKLSEARVASDKAATEAKAQIERERIENENKTIKAMENFKQVTADPAFNDKLIDDMVKKLPQTQFSDFMMKNTLSMAIKSSFLDVMRNHNMRFDDEAENPKQHLTAGAKAVFKNAFVLAKTFGYNTPKDRLAVAQIMTDKVMQKLSPAATDPKEYGDFANGYALRHAEEFNDVLGADKISAEDLEKVFAEANKRYGDLTREPVAINEFANVSKDNVSAPVEKEPDVKNLKKDF